MVKKLTSCWLIAFLLTWPIIGWSQAVMVKNRFAFQAAAAGGSFPTTDLIAHYRLNEASGTRVDVHGGNDLTDNGSVGSVAGKLGDAANLDNDLTKYLNRTGDADFGMDANTSYEICGWIYVDNIGAGWGPAIGLYSTDRVNSLSIWRTSSTVLRVYYGDPSNASVTATSASLSSGTWYFVNIYHDAANEKIGIIIDNGTPVETTGLVNDTTTKADGEFWIGWDGVYGAGVEGDYDSWSVYGRLLTAQERTDLYNAGAGLDY